MIKPSVRRVLIPVLLLGASAAGFVLLVKTRPASPALSVEEKAWLVAVERAEPRPIEPTIQLLGRVESPRVARLVAGIEADVVEVRAREGAYVAPGDLLVRLDDGEARLLLAQREAELAEIEGQIQSERQRHQRNVRALEHEKALLELTRRGVERASELVANRVGAKAALDEARQAMERQALALNELEFSLEEHAARVFQLEARKRRAEALRDDAALDVERTRVRSPFRGRVAKVQVSPGDRARVGTPLAEVFDRDALEIRAQIPSRYLPMVRDAIGNGVSLDAIANVDGQPLPVELDRLAGQVERGTGGVDGLFRIQARDAPLALGRSVPLRLRLPAQANALPVPFEALYGTDRLYKVVDGRLEGVGAEWIGEVEDAQGQVRALVRSPEIDPGDTILVTQVPRAISGLRVRVQGDVPSDSVAQLPISDAPDPPAAGR